ncbi:RagB/SusD family nutrient uptake outer membrane protein [Pedobacter sp.]|uniref:RagB/SusD family nutrient uptake outer membrane protein n=1 Tax=Pedobacter sp. TaxID=1411316 RepID=UPI0031D03D96
MKLNKMAFLLGSVCCLLGCEEFLAEKPDQRLATIETIKDMQALLDDYAKLNYSDPAMAEVYGDNYFMADEVFNARNEYDRNMYVFADARIFQPKLNVWNNVYTQVNIANIVLQAVRDKEQRINDRNGISLIRAQALFFRAKAFFNALNVWTMPYNVNSAGALPGIPLRLNANFNLSSTRSTIAEGYRQVIADFKESCAVLPLHALTPMRPSKASAYGMLSRVYLQMRDYVQAEKYADSCLQLKSGLLDYNTLNAGSNYPVPKLNVEVVFEGRGEMAAPLVQERALIKPDLYQLYEANDLRKTIFFKASGKNFVFKGSYEAAASIFNGITTAEMLLSRSECLIRNGDVQKGLDDLNTLLRHRYKTGTFSSINVVAKEDALVLVKAERRKELAFRCMRWLDIRRFNEEGDGIVIRRTINGKTFTLIPRSNSYALAIPEDVIELSGMKQNEP